MNDDAVPAPATYVGAILTAVRSFNQLRICSILDDACRHHDVDVIVDEVILPSLRVVATFWSSGTVDVAHDHMLSTAVGRWIAARSVSPLGQSRRGIVLLSAGPQDLQTIALDCLDLLLARRGVEVCNIGGQTPVNSLLIAARAVHPAAIVVASQTPTGASQAVRSVQAASDAGYPVYYTGTSFASQFFRQNIPGTPLDGTLSEAAELITARHTTPPPEPQSLPRRVYQRAPDHSTT